MPEYLAPGVFVEEVSFRSKSIEGVPTSTTGYAGMTAFGPVFYDADGPRAQPRLVTSSTEFERVYGGLQPLSFDGNDRTNFMAHGARAFFNNGGKRLYVSRVFQPKADDPNKGCAASPPIAVDGRPVYFRARWPGAAGNVAVEVQAVRSGNIARVVDAGGQKSVQVQRARHGAVLEVLDPDKSKAREKNQPDRVDAGDLVVMEVDAEGKQSFKRNGQAVNIDPGKVVRLVELRVRVYVSDYRIDSAEELSTHKDQKRFIGTVLDLKQPEDEDAVVYLDLSAPAPAIPAPAGDHDHPAPAAAAAGGPFDAVRLLAGLVSAGRVRLAGGNDGVIVEPDDLAGRGADPDDNKIPATGLEALGEIDDIAIVALPDGGAYGDGRDLDRCAAAADRLVNHAERLRYRIAVVDPPLHSSLNAVRAFRGRFDSKYAAMYHPWVEILDPLARPAAGSPPRKMMLPPSGFVTGIYARSDIQRGVHKAPANEVVSGLSRLEMNINQGRQEVLNPEGINALRFFEGRGSRVWGARTISSDPEWKYVNVRRLFIYLEHSIDKSTQWAVFEPNSEALWRNIRQTVSDFLLQSWKDGALMGSKPEEAFFVRCDRTTMTQNDIDNGRMVCLIGVAPVKPAEFVIFRIGQWTANAKD